jgi:mutual gliding-motility protein MglA
MFINHSSKEVTAKVVYYGPGLSGKTTNLQYIFSITNPKTRGELISIETEIERTLFFDLLPINVGLINGYQAKFQLYTVPGQVFYDSTRKLVLKGADGIVFVADSQELMKTANLESLENLKKNLFAHKLDINDIPLVVQYNKRDLNNTLPTEDLNRLVNSQLKRPYFNAVAIEGDGVIETLRAISSLILTKIKNLLDHNGEESSPKSPAVAFDTDKKYKIFDQDNVPLKKIQADNLEAASEKIAPAAEVVTEIPIPQPTTEPEPILDSEPVLPSNPPPHAVEEEEEMLTVETLDSMGDYNDLEELMLGDDMEQVDELPDLAEIKLDEEDSFPAFEESGEHGTVELDDGNLSNINEDTNELVENNLDDLAIPTDLSVESAHLINEMDAFELGEVDDSQLTDENELSGLDEIPLLEEVVEPVNPAVPKEIPKEEHHEIEALKQSIATQNGSKSASKNKIPDPRGLDLFEKLKDDSRVTVIRNVQVKDKQFIIDIKDKNSNLLESVMVDITPETRKVTLILDVKK